MSRLRVAPDRAQELVAAFRDRAHLVDRAPGFVDLEVWQNDRDPTELVMVSRWTDRSCFKTYMKSEAHRISHHRIDSELDAEIQLQALEHTHGRQIDLVEIDLETCIAPDAPQVAERVRDGAVFISSRESFLS
jgi:heme-degrading monooxygenase HmoA